MNKNLFCFFGFVASFCVATVQTFAQAGEFSSAFGPAATLAVMQRVADWQLAHPDTNRLTGWIDAAGDAGMMALAGISADPKYRDAMHAKGETNGWRLPEFWRVLGSQWRFHKPSSMGELCKALCGAPRPAVADQDRKLTECGLVADMTPRLDERHGVNNF
jgi:hypothetical protein